MDFKQGGQAIQRIRKERGMTQEQLAMKSGVSANTVSRIERGLLVPALPTLISLCNALDVGSGSVLSSYIAVETPIRWSNLSQTMAGLSEEKQDKLETILNCLIDTI